jgi:DNA-binding response OmpR family regulator
MEKELKKVLVLIKEDDPFLARVCVNKFNKQEGWEAAISSSYEEILEKLSPEVNLVMTELLPGKDSIKTGFDLIEEIKNNDSLKDIKVVVFTDLSQESDKERALGLGAEKYFVKDEVTINSVIDEIKGMF